MIEIGSIWIPGPRLRRHIKPRIIVGFHRVDTDLVYTRTATVDGVVVSARPELFRIDCLTGDYLPLARLSGEDG